MTDENKVTIFTNKHTTITDLKCSWADDWEQVVIPDEEFDEPDIVVREEDFPRD